jgi:hypothetical protein
MLGCDNCRLLTNLPDTLVNLTELYCENCPGIISIPDSLINLKTLSCNFTTLKERNFKFFVSEWMRLNTNQ